MSSFSKLPPEVALAFLPSHCLQLAISLFPLITLFVLYTRSGIILKSVCYLGAVETNAYHHLFPE